MRSFGLSGKNGFRLGTNTKADFGWEFSRKFFFVLLHPMPRFKMGDLTCYCLEPWLGTARHFYFTFFLRSEGSSLHKCLSIFWWTLVSALLKSLGKKPQKTSNAPVFSKCPLRLSWLYLIFSLPVLELILKFLSFLSFFLNWGS